MSKKELFIRYLIFAPGVFVLAFGIAFITKAGLGTSPISSIPYTLSLIIPAVTLGEFTIIVNVAIVIAEVIILWGKPGTIMGRPGGKALPWSEAIVQVAISFALGYCIDFSMWLLRWFDPHSYPAQVAFVVLGCIIMAFGIYIQLGANVAMAPGDALARSIAAVTGKTYPNIRLISDASMVTVSAILCIIFLHALTGVREGTVICAALTGNVIRVYRRFIPIDKAIKKLFEKQDIE